MKADQIIVAIYIIGALSVLVWGARGIARARRNRKPGHASLDDICPMELALILMCLFWPLGILVVPVWWWDTRAHRRRQKRAHRNS